MKKANSSGTNCTTRRYAEVPSPRLLEPPGQDQPGSRKTIILFGPKILFKDFDRMKRYANIRPGSSLSKSLKAPETTPEQIRSRTDETHANATTQGHQHSVRPADRDFLNTREERFGAHNCAELERARHF